MISKKLKMVSRVTNDDTITRSYVCRVPVKLAGDSIWDCKDTDVTITLVQISKDIDSSYRHISVHHNGSWRVYTDTGFESAVAELLGDPDVEFTEQGMQEDGVASLESYE